MEPSFDSQVQPPRTFLRAYVYDKLVPAPQAFLALGFLVLATKGIEGVDAASESCDSSGSNVPSLVDGILALILSVLWGLRTYCLSQSYAYNRAPYWGWLRNIAFWMSIVSIVMAGVAIPLGWCIPKWSTMQNVVAVVVGALAVATAERRAQGPASARLKLLQHMLQRPYYRENRTKGHGYADNLGRRLFQELDKLPGKPVKIGGWDCSYVEETTGHCVYYVKPGPISDHFLMGRYQVLEAAGSGHDPLAFAAAHASVTAAYMLRPRLEREMVHIVSYIAKASERVLPSTSSWRPGALAQLLGIDKFKLPDINQVGNWPTLLQDTNTILVLWGVCWLEEASTMEAIMEKIAKYMSQRHAGETPWNPADDVPEMMREITEECWPQDKTTAQDIGKGPTEA